MPRGVYPRTEEYRTKIRATMKIVMNRPEVRKKCSDAHIGKPRTEDAVQKGIETRRNNGRPWFSKESKQKIGVATRKRCSDPNYMKKFSASQRKRWEDPEEHKKHSIIAKKVHNTTEAIENHRRAATGVYPSEEAIKKMEDSAKEKWADPEYKEKQLKAIFKGLNLLPNKPEKFLIKLLQKLFSNQWKFVGDGSCWITSDGKHLNPDFIHVNQKKIIEHFGEYHHGVEVTGIPNEQHEQQRIDLFAKHGYQTLIIWEHELKNVNSLVEKLIEFDRS